MTHAKIILKTNLILILYLLINPILCQTITNTNTSNEQIKTSRKSGWNQIIRFNTFSYNLSIKDIEYYRVGETCPSGYSVFYRNELVKSSKMSYSVLNGLEFINGYSFDKPYFIGFGLGYNHEYHKSFRDALICNFPIFVHQRFNFSKNKNSFTVNTSIGKNFVLNSKHSIRPYSIYGKVLFSFGVGFMVSIKNIGAIFVDIDLENKNFTFENYSYDNIGLKFIKLKLGFKPNF